MIEEYIKAKIGREGQRKKQTKRDVGDGNLVLGDKAYIRFGATKYWVTE